MECITLGEFKICIVDDKTVWIERPDGEGSEFNINKVEEIIRGFYETNF